jgi:hypothetical protein
VANRLYYKLGKIPIRYLGLLVSDKPLRVAAWDFLPEKSGSYG